jgi:hypothetical protein
MDRNELRLSIRKIINEDISDFGEDVTDFEDTPAILSVDECYDNILKQLEKYTRALNDDDAFQLHERLKKFFNRTI